MTKVKIKKKELKWSRNRFGELAHSYCLDGKEIASIFPKETKDGKIHWGFWIDRLEGNKEINTDNSKLIQTPVELNPTYAKRKDIKKKIEEVVLKLLGD